MQWEGLAAETWADTKADKSPAPAAAVEAQAPASQERGETQATTAPTACPGQVATAGSWAAGGLAEAWDSVWVAVKTVGALDSGVEGLEMEGGASAMVADGATEASEEKVLGTAEGAVTEAVGAEVSGDVARVEAVGLATGAASAEAAMRRETARAPAQPSAPHHPQQPQPSRHQSPHNVLPRPLSSPQTIHGADLSLRRTDTLLQG